MNTYEAMFVMDAGMAADWQAVEGEIERLTGRAQAEVLCCRRWDERRLAYEIGPHKRGCYVLTYLRADPTRISGLERDAQLSEHILRMLVLRADHVSEEEIRSHAQAGAEQAAVMRSGERTDEPEDARKDKPVTVEAEAPPPDTQADAAEQEKPAAADVVPDSQAPAAPPATDQTPGDANPEEPTPLP